MVRGKQPLRVECAPAFHYALHEHRTSLVPDDTIPGNGENTSDKQKRALFESDELTMDLRFIAESVVDGIPSPSVDLQILNLMPQGHKGSSIYVDLDLVEGQVVTFVLRTPPKATKEPYNAGAMLDVAELPSVTNLRKKEDPPLTKVFVTGFFLSQVVLTTPKNLLRDLLLGTNDYWNAWIRGSTYEGSWKEAVHRSALALKLLIYEPTGSFMVILITISQLSVRCRGCQPNVQSTRIHWRNQKLVGYCLYRAVSFSLLLYN